MNITMFIYTFLLFFVLTPGVLVCLPPKGSKTVVALTHALVFTIVWCLTNKMVLRATSGIFENLMSNNGLGNTEYDNGKGYIGGPYYFNGTTNLDFVDQLRKTSDVVYCP